MSENDEVTSPEENDEALRLVNDVVDLMAASTVAGLRIEEQGGPESRAAAHNLLLHRFTATAIGLLLNLAPEERDSYRKHLAMCVTEAPVGAVTEIAESTFAGGLWAEAEARAKRMVDGSQN